MKYHQATGSRSYVVQMQKFVSDGCVLLLLLPERYYKCSSCKYILLIPLKTTEVIVIKEGNVVGA